jgi:hypothetical protein
MGAAAAAAGAGGVAFAPSAFGAPSGGDGSFGSGTGVAPAAGALLGGLALTPGLAYGTLDASDFSAQNPQIRDLNLNGAQPATPIGNILFCAPRLPVGAVLKEIAVAYVNPAGAMSAELWRMTFGATYALLANVVLTASATPQIAALNPPTQPATDGTETYMVLTRFNATNQFVQGLRFGFVPPAQAFVPLPAVTRVLDTRITGGKLNPNEERVVNLGVPGFAKAAVINVTVTDTEVAGFVAVFAANVAWPGNSTINWSATGQNLANTAITAVDPSGQIKIRGGVNRTDVVIDVQGYLL